MVTRDYDDVSCYVHPSGFWICIICIFGRPALASNSFMNFGPSSITNFIINTVAFNNAKSSHAVTKRSSDFPLKDVTWSWVCLPIVIFEYMYNEQSNIAQSFRQKLGRTLRLGISGPYMLHSIWLYYAALMQISAGQHSRLVKVMKLMRNHSGKGLCTCKWLLRACCLHRSLHLQWLLSALPRLTAKPFQQASCLTFCELFLAWLGNLNTRKLAYVYRQHFWGLPVYAFCLLHSSNVNSLLATDQSTFKVEALHIALVEVWHIANR